MPKKQEEEQDRWKVQEEEEKTLIFLQFVSPKLVEVHIIERIHQEEKEEWEKEKEQETWQEQEE